MTLFEQNIVSTYGDKGKQWLLNLPVLVESYTSLWHLSDLVPLENLSYSYVLSGSMDSHHIRNTFCHTREGGYLERNVVFLGNTALDPRLRGDDIEASANYLQPIILKLSPDNRALQRERAALTALGDHGAVSIFEWVPDALLLQRACPGYSLQSTFPNDDSNCMEIALRAMQRLHQAPLPDAQDFPRLSAWFKVLDKTLDIDDKYLLAARNLKNQLLTSSSAVFLHGDLHHDNILRHNETWVVIDPKGIIGDPLYEATVFIRNPIKALTSLPYAADLIHKRIDQCSRYLDVPSEHLTKWCFCSSVLSLIWCLEDGVDAKAHMNMVEIMYDLMTKHP